MRPIERYLDEVKRKRDIPSENAFARELGMKASSLYLIRRGINTPSEETCKKLAKLGGDPYEKVLLLAQVSKAPEVSRSAWERILKATAKAGVFTLGMALFINLAVSTIAQASGAHAIRSTLAAGASKPADRLSIMRHVCFVPYWAMFPIRQ